MAGRGTRRSSPYPKGRLAPFRKCATVAPFWAFRAGSEVVSRNRNLNGRLYEIVEELVRRGVPLEQARREFERQFIVAALRTHEGNLSQSAQSIGVHRNTLRNKVCNLGISGEDYTGRAVRRRRTV